MFLATIVHCLIFASFAGALRFTMQRHNQILCLNGYLLGFSGLHAIVLMISSLVSVLLCGITDTLYGHKILYKICFASLTVASCVLSWVVFFADFLFYFHSIAGQLVRLKTSVRLLVANCTGYFWCFALQYCSRNGRRDGVSSKRDQGIRSVVCFRFCR